MSRLSDLVNEAVILNTKDDGSLTAHDAVLFIKPSLDDDDRDVLVTEALVARVTDAAKKGKSSVLAAAKKQNMELPFNLNGAYPLDIDQRYIKRTENLSRLEMQRVISIREKQIADDTKHLAELRAAFRAVEPIWDTHPDWTFGECCNELIARAA